MNEMGIFAKRGLFEKFEKNTHNFPISDVDLQTTYHHILPN